MKVDYHVHGVSHGEYKYSFKWLASFVEQAKKMGLNEMGFSEHDEFIGEVEVDLIREVSRLNPDIPIKIGLEVDYKPGAEDNIKQLSRSKLFDYLIGSVHIIDDWPFDHPDYQYRFNDFDIDDIYIKYFNLVHKSAKSGLFDIIGHFDLIKIWGHRPPKNIINYVEPVLVSIKEAHLTIEINSAGLRKPVAEIYPQYEIIELMHKMDIGITFGSDAHHPSQMGLGVDEAIALAKRAGYKKVITFKQRDKKILPL